MSLDERRDLSVEAWEEGCDVRVWSGECEHERYSTIAERYLCVTCGKITGLNHEVRHEIFPHIKGDTDNLY